MVIHDYVTTCFVHRIPGYYIPSSQPSPSQGILLGHIFMGRRVDSMAPPGVPRMKKVWSENEMGRSGYLRLFFLFRLVWETV